MYEPLDAVVFALVRVPDPASSLLVKAGPSFEVRGGHPLGGDHLGDIVQERVAVPAGHVPWVCEFPIVVDDEQGPAGEPPFEPAEEGRRLTATGAEELV